MRLFSIARLGTLALLAIGLVACDDYPTKPPPVLSYTPKATVIPEVTAAALTNVDVPEMALSMLIPSNWKQPVYQDNSNLILSPDGSTSTSYNAGPFVIIRVGDSTYFQKLLAFQTTLTDPLQRLDSMLTGINRDAASFTPAQLYPWGKYPGAYTTGYERDNQLSIVLLKAGPDRWVYIGTQAKEIYFTYYDTAVFQPLINSITLR